MRRLALALLLASLCACRTEPQLPEGAQLRCTRTADCPEGSSCVVALGRCLSPAAPCVEPQGDALVPAADGNRCTLSTAAPTGLAAGAGAGAAGGICLRGLCAESRCGDGYRDAARESCDEGTANSDTRPDACRRDCTLARCGDAVIDSDEACDDGNLLAGDGCRADCSKVELCGDALLDEGEACDDGNPFSGDGCRGDCRKVELCGDGELDSGEACDDANTASGDGCRGDCRKAEACGDGVLDANETCDDQNPNANDGCHACQLTRWVATAVIGAGQDSTSLSTFAFYVPSAIASDPLGRLAVADAGHRVWLVDPAAGRVTRLAGTGAFGYSGDGGRATDANLWSPRALAFDVRGNLFIADTGNHRIRRVDAKTGVITTVAGTGAACPAGESCGDGGSATAARLNRPEGLTVDRQGTLYLSDTHAHRVRRIDAATGVIRTVAGDGTSCSPYNSLCGDGGPATSARLYYPGALAITRGDTLYIADSLNQRVRALDLALATPPITTVAGTVGSSCPTTDPTQPCGDGGPATAGRFNFPVGLALDAAGDLYVSDLHLHRVRKIDFGSGAALLSAVAGTGQPCPASVLHEECGDGAAATAGKLNAPMGLAIAGGHLYIADSGDHRLRRVDLSTGVLTTLAGSGQAGGRGDGGAATAATYDMPRGVAVDRAGNIFVADHGGHRVRRIDAATGVVTTFAGTGVACPTPGGGCGDGVPATRAFVTPIDLATDAGGNLYIADFGNRLVRRVDAATRIITTVAGDGGLCTTAVSEDACGDGGPARGARLGLPVGLALRGNALYLGQGGSPRVRVIPDLTAATPVIENLVGDGTPCADPTTAPACGDGGELGAAQLNFPASLAFDSAGDLYIADGGQYRIRKAALSQALPTLGTAAGRGVSCGSLSEDCGDGGPATGAAMNVRELIVDADGALLFTDYTGAVRRVAGGLIMRVAGEPIPGSGRGDGGPVRGVSLQGPEGLALDPRGDLVVADTSATRLLLLNRRDDLALPLSSVDPLGDGPSSAAMLGGPAALVALPDGERWLIADGGSGRLRLFDRAAGWLSTVAGYPQGRPEAEDARARYRALLADAAGLALDAANAAVYVALRGDHTIQKLSLVDPDAPETWTLSTAAGAVGMAGHADHDSDPLQARFSAPRGLAFDAKAGVLYVADAGNHLVRAFAPSSGRTWTVAGESGVAAYGGDGGPAELAWLDTPSAVELSASGELYVADTGNNRVRRIAAGTITTVLGDGAPASSGAGAPASSYPVDHPEGLAFDVHGNLFVTSRNTVRLVASGSDGVVTGEDRVDTIYGTAPRDTFPASATGCLTGLALTADAARALVLDGCTGLLVELARQ